MLNTISREEWDAFTPEQQWEYMRLCEAESKRYSDVIRQIPPCPKHGDMCLSHAAEWIASSDRTSAYVECSPYRFEVKETQ